MEDALIDTGAIRCFAGIDLAKDNIPDATTILAFRHFVEQHHLAKEIFKTVEQYLEEKGLLLREGTVVDATIIHAPISTNNEKKERDPQMHQTHKGTTGKPLSDPVLAFQKLCCKRGVTVFCESALMFSRVSLKGTSGSLA